MSGGTHVETVFPLVAVCVVVSFTSRHLLLVNLMEVDTTVLHSKCVWFI